VSLFAPAVSVKLALHAKPASTRPRDVVADVQLMGPTELAMAVQAAGSVVVQASQTVHIFEGWTQCKAFRYN
jgi:hypothetical protein